MQGTKPDQFDAVAKQNAVSMRKGLIEFSVMSICSVSPVYVGQIIEQLQAAEMPVVEGTLYPLLSRLNKSGHVSYEWQESKTGPPRKYYRLTDEGQKVLDEYQKQWKKLKSATDRLGERK